MMKNRKREIMELLNKLATYPQVALIFEKVPCDGYRYSSMPLRAYRNPELKETYRCKRNARLHFSARLTKNDWEFSAESGNFCLQHFSDNLYGCDSEVKRLQVWWDSREKDTDERVKFLSSEL